MSLTCATLATYLPTGALTVDGSGNWTLNFTALAPASTPHDSFVNPLSVLLAGLEKMMAKVNSDRAALVPSFPPITFISRTIGGSSRTGAGDATLVTEDYSIHFEYSDALLSGATSDPAAGVTY